MATIRPSRRIAVVEMVLSLVVLGLLGLALWTSTDSDDDNGGGGMMQPVLVPVRVRRYD
ncbi:conserved protein of unknown function [Cyanobium sp. NIES-981]|nr:conserved protein of unknown function [Cyanobium sp. NIES-981]